MVSKVLLYTTFNNEPPPPPPLFLVLIIQINRGGGGAFKIKKAGLEPANPAPKADMLPITSFPAVFGEATGAIEITTASIKGKKKN